MARTAQGGARAARGPRVVCPECGGEFSARGIATHRRLKHGGARAPAAGAQDGLAQRLDGLAAVLERIEGRLAALEGCAGFSGEAPAPRRSEVAELRAELDEVLGRIAAKVAAAAELEDALDGDLEADAASARRSLHRELGALRRRQLLLLMRLGPEAPGAPPGWGVGGFGA
jgi:hypothetical protein